MVDVQSRFGLFNKAQRKYRRLITADNIISSSLDKMKLRLYRLKKNYRRSQNKLRVLKTKLLEESVNYTTESGNYWVHINSMKHSALIQVENYAHYIRNTTLKQSIKESIGKRRFVLYLLCIILFIFYIASLVGLQDFKNQVTDQFRTPEAGRSVWGYDLPDVLFKEMIDSINQYKLKMLDAWAIFFNRASSMLVIFLTIISLYIYLPLKQVLNFIPIYILFFFLILFITIVGIVLVSYAGKLNNKGLFFVRLLSGQAFLYKHLKDEKRYSLYLRNFSSEVSGIDVNLKRIMSTIWAFEDVNIDEMDEDAEVNDSIDNRNFNAQFFSFIKKKLPIFQLANIDYTGHLNELIPIYTEDDNWFSIVTRLINNTALIIIYITKEAPGIVKEIDYICTHDMCWKTIVIVDDLSSPFMKKEAFQNIWEKDRLAAICAEAKNNPEILYELLNLNVILHQSARRHNR